MLLLLTHLALAACPELPVDQRSAIAPLHPVRPAYVRETVQMMDLLSGGPGASPAFRDTWTRMEIELALASQDSLAGAPRLTPTEQERSRDLAISAASMAGEAMVHQTLNRSNVLRGTLFAARTLGSPSLEVRPAPQGPKVRVNQTPPNRFQDQQVARYGIAPGQGPGRGRRTPPPKRVQLGGGSSVITEDLSPQAVLGVAWTAWLQADRYGLDSVRLAMDVARVELGGVNSRGQAIPGRADLALAWTVNARHKIHPRWITSAEVRSVATTYYPKHVRGGIGYQPVKRDHRWIIRLDARYALATPDRGPEQRVDLRVQWNGRWRTPVSARRPVPGQRAVQDPWWAPQPVPGPNRVSACEAAAPRAPAPPGR